MTRCDWEQNPKWQQVIGLTPAGGSDSLARATVGQVDAGDSIFGFAPIYYRTWPDDRRSRMTIPWSDTIGSGTDQWGPCRTTTIPLDPGQFLQFGRHYFSM